MWSVQCQAGPDPSLREQQRWAGTQACSQLTHGVAESAWLRTIAQPTHVRPKQQPQATSPPTRGAVAKLLHKAVAHVVLAPPPVVALPRCGHAPRLALAVECRRGSCASDTRGKKQWWRFSAPSEPRPTLVHTCLVLCPTLIEFSHLSPQHCSAPCFQQQTKPLQQSHLTVQLLLSPPAWCRVRL